MNRFYTTIGYKCNQNCLNCIIDKDVREQDEKLDFKIFDEIISNYEIKPDDIFEITGGEPTQYKERFLKLLKRSKELGFVRSRVNVLSNAMSFSSKSFTKKSAPFFGHIVSTFYSHDENKHDKITGMKGSFLKKYQGLKNLEKEGVILHIKTLISRYNYKYLVDFIEFCNNNFPNSYLLITWVDYRGDAWDNNDELLVKHSEVIPFIEKALELANNYNLKYNLLFPFCLIDPFYLNGIIPVNITDDLDKVIFIDPMEKNNYKEGPGNEIRFIEKPNECIGCILKERCVFEWKSYNKIFSLSDLKPIN